MNLFSGKKRQQEEANRLEYFLSCIPPGVMPIGPDVDVSKLTMTVYHAECKWCGYVTAKADERPTQCVNCWRRIPMLLPLEG